ncbi:MAG: HD-GYP domain-containing protein [Actinobacteria bacterium]|nr:HD-GYP domain-containing protein [Actinomycetota bacterium]
MDIRVKALASAGLSGCLAVILYLALARDMPVFWFSVVLLGALMVVCETMGEKMSSGGRSTYGIMVIFAAVASLNTPSAMIVALCGAFHLRMFERRQDPWELAATGSIYSLCAWASSAVYHALGGASRAFTLSGAMRSLLPLLVAAGVFWALNALAVAAVLRWRDGVEPARFLLNDALRLLPNHLLYALVGLGMGVIYAQNAFHVALDLENRPLLDAAGNQVILGSAAEALRGLFALLAFTAILGVAWYFSGKNIALLESYDRSMEALVTHMERREPYLDGHAVRVAEHAARIASHMRLPVYEVNRLRHAALLHDLGRPVIPRGILLQRAPLSGEEFERVRAHPLEGAARLEEVSYLSDMAEAVRHHHEYYDGGGYVDGLKGETIPLSARILAVADAYDAMVHPRPWRDAKSHEAALAELRENAGRQFDPEIVEHFIASLQAEEGRAVRRGEEQAAVAEKGGAAEAAPGEPAVVPGRERSRRRARRREEILRERREARERLEREAMLRLQEERGEAAPREGAAGEDEPGDAPGGEER